MTQVSWDLMRELAGFRSADGAALSFYVKLDPSESPTPPSLATRFSSLISHIEKAQLGNHDETRRAAAIRRGVDQVRNWARAAFERDGARGVALFVSPADGYWRELYTPQPVRDHVEVDRQFSLVPLVSLAEEPEATYVAVMSRERGQVFRLVEGRLEEVVAQSDEVPGRHAQGGWSQARYRRHIEHLVREHLKAVGGELAGQVRRARPAQLVIVAPEELRHEIETKLSSETREAIAGWAQAEAHATPDELLQAVRPVLVRVHETRRRELLARWHEQLGRDGRATAGWHDTLEAASDARVELLLATEIASRVAYRCPQCLRAAAEPGTCPLDGSVLEEHDALDLALHQTLVHGGGVLGFAEPPPELESVGALLRF